MKAIEAKNMDKLNINPLEKKTTPYPLSGYLIISQVTNNYEAFLTSLQNKYIPRNYDEALTIPHWKLPIQKELKALEANQTWDIVQLPPMKKHICYRWVFILKY